MAIRRELAAAAATAAAEMLLSQKKTETVAVSLPGGENALFSLQNIEIGRDRVRCSVTKDGGDDPDVTHGAEIFAEVRFGDQEGAVGIIGGKGVGVVTAKGLQCAVGEPAINPVPRKMIRENCRRILEKYGAKRESMWRYPSLAEKRDRQKTFNPRLGIEGGISILGTTGIVRTDERKSSGRYDQSGHR